MDKTMKIKKIAAEKIIEPPFADRFPEDSKKKSGKIEKAVHEVVYSKQSQKYVVVRGRRTFRAGLAQQVERFRCLVIGKVERDSDAWVERIANVLIPRKKFHILEQALALMHFKERLIGQYGEEAFYVNGGDRRSEDSRRIKIWKLLKKRMPSKKYRISTLLRFGQMVGVIGLEGLYRVVRANGMKLRVRQIHLRNGHLREIDITEKIEEAIWRLRAEGCSEGQIKDEVGLIILNELRVAEPKPRKKDDPKDEETAGAGQGKPDGEENIKAEEGGRSEGIEPPPLPRDTQLIEKEELERIVEKGKVATERLQGIVDSLESAIPFTVKDKDAIESLFTQLQLALGEFEHAYFEAIDTNYPGRGEQCQFCHFLIDAREKQE